jgi:hypothetical protein
MKKLLVIVVLALFAAGMLSSCAVAETSKDMDIGGYEGSVMDNGDALTGTAGSTDVPQLENQKLVKKVWLDAETEDLDQLLSAVDERISQLSGYVEEREVYNGSGTSRRNRYANITIRIPVASLSEFVEHVTENANITSTNETSENITLSYVATQSRITALETEQTRLLELLAMAESMEDLLKIEERLTEVRTDLEEVTSQLRVYDNMVDYGTVYLDIREVREYTVTEEPETVWERIGSGFVRSVKNVVTILRELFIFFIVAIPYLAVPALLVAAVILLVKLRKYRKKKKNKKTQDNG